MAGSSKFRCYFPSIPKKSLPEAGKKVHRLGMKVKWFFQHSFWCFGCALKVKENRLTRVEPVCMSLWAAKKHADVLRKGKRRTWYSVKSSGVTWVLLCITVSAWIWIFERRPVVISASKWVIDTSGSCPPPFKVQRVTFSRENLRKCDVE